MNKSIWLVILAGFVALLIGCHAGGNAPFVNVPSESDIVSFEREVDKNGRFDDITFPSGAVIKCTQDDTLKKGTKINATEQKISDGNPAYIYNITAKLITNDALNTSVSVNTLEKPISVTLPNDSTTGTCYIGTRASDSDPWRYSLVTDSLADIRFARLQASTPSQCNFNLYRLGINFAIFVLNNQSKEEAEVDSVEITPTEDVEYKDEKYISDLNIKVKVSGEKLDGIKTDNLKARIVYRSDSLNPEQLKANGSIVKQTDSDDNAVSGTYEHTFEVSNINIESQMSGEAVVSFVLNLAGVNLQAFPTTFLVEFYSDGKAENTLPFIYTQAFSFETKEQQPEPEPLVTYTITYDLDGGEPTGNNPSEYTVESEFTLSNPTKTGYTFLGWTGTDLDKATTQVTIDKCSTGDRTYTANFTPIDYEISYLNVDGATFATVNPSTYNIETETFTLNNPTKDDYTFAGWSGTDLTGDTNKEVKITKGSTGERTYTAHFVENYNITYDLADGSLPQGTTNPATYSVLSDTITLNNPTRKNYVFLGWTGTGIEEGTASETVKIYQGTTGARSYVASWTLADVLVFNLDDSNTVTLEMRKCPAGTFIMGSPNNELGRSLPYADYDETQHSVTISKDFWMGTYEVTQAQYRAIMGDNPSFNTSDSETVLPVERILWIDLMTPSTGFMDIINEKLKNQLPEGYKFDLPTDAQWEYACRAGTETSLNNGTSIVNTGSVVEDTYLNAVGWYFYNWGNEKQKSHSIGKLAPNSFGLYDMHGNVSEWVKDWYDGSYYQYCIDNNITIDPQGPETGSERVTRGGDLSYNPAYCRSAARNPLSPDGYRSKCNGFRLALVKE